MNKRLRIITALLVLVCLFTGCSSRRKPAPDEYKTYLCYDYHLACLEIEKEIFWCSLTEETSVYADYANQVIFRKIKDLADNQFVYASFSTPIALGLPQKLVLQNPDNYVDVWESWSIKRIELFYVDHTNPINQNKPATIPSVIAGSSESNDIFEKLRSFVDSVDYNEKFESPKGYIKEHSSNNNTGAKSFYIRVYFNESDNLVWDTELDSYYSSETQHRIITIDKGRLPDDYYFMSADYVPLEDNSELYSWLNLLLDEFS